MTQRNLSARRFCSTLTKRNQKLKDSTSYHLLPKNPPHPSQRIQTSQKSRKYFRSLFPRLTLRDQIANRRYLTHTDLHFPVTRDSKLSSVHCSRLRWLSLKGSRWAPSTATIPHNCLPRLLRHRKQSSNQKSRLSDDSTSTAKRTLRKPPQSCRMRTTFSAYIQLLWIKAHYLTRTSKPSSVICLPMRISKPV